MSVRLSTDGIVIVLKKLTLEEFSSPWSFAFKALTFNDITGAKPQSWLR